MKKLLIEEMKRAIEIMESKDEIKTMKMVPGYYSSGEHLYPVVDRDTSELKQILKMIRKHSIILERGIK